MRSTWSRQGVPAYPKVKVDLKIYPGLVDQTARWVGLRPKLNHGSTRSLRLKHTLLYVQSMHRPVSLPRDYSRALSYNLYADQMPTNANADAPAKTKKTFPSPLSSCFNACCNGKNTEP